MENNLNLNPKELREMMIDYNFNTGNTEYDDDMIDILSAFSAISEADRIILCLYAENQSLRKTAKTLGVSYATTRKAVAKIRGEIIEEIKKNKVIL